MPTPPSPIHAQVFDVLISRIGLSQFIAKLDDLLKDPAFVTASTVSALPHQVTRAFAAAATSGENDESWSGRKAHV